MITQHHRIVVQGRTEGRLITSDFAEVQESREDLEVLLLKLNAQQRAMEEGA